MLWVSIGAWHKPQPELCSAARAVGTHLLSEAVLTSDKPNVTNLSLPRSEAITSQGSRLSISFPLEPFQRRLRELLLRDYSCLSDLCSRTRNEQHSSTQGSDAHRAILAQLCCRHRNSPRAEYSTLRPAAGFLIIDTFQKNHRMV